LQYAESNTFGRMVRFAAGPISERAAGSAGQPLVTDELREALAATVAVLSSAGPRVVSHKPQVVPVCLFTDGAVEGSERGLVTVGAVLHDPLTGLKECFGFEVPRALSAEWRGRGSLQVVGQAEILPVLVGKAFWAPVLRDRRVLVFVDNTSAAAALVKGHSPNPSSNALLRKYAALEAAFPTCTWFARVPSPSNPADGPSRLDFGEACGRLGAVQVVVPECLRDPLGRAWDSWLAAARDRRP
jgi:hypothetical protein